MRFRDFHRNVKIRIGLSFLSGTANNMVLPFMSIFIGMVMFMRFQVNWKNVK